MTDTPSPPQPPPPPPPPPPEASGPFEPVEPESNSSKKRLLIGGGIIAVIVVIVALLLMGGDDDKTDVEARLASQIKSEADGEISDEQADCVAGHLVDEIGADRLDDVDFDEDPPADLEDELTTAFFGAIGECDIDPTMLGSDAGDDSTDDGATDDDASDDGATDDGVTDDLGEIEFDEDMEAMLADVYEQSLGLEREKAECLAGRLADAIESGDLTEEQAMSDIFSYLEECDISMEEISN